MPTKKEPRGQVPVVAFPCKGSDGRKGGISCTVVCEDTIPYILTPVMDDCFNGDSYSILLFLMVSCGLDRGTPYLLISIFSYVVFP